MKTRIVTTVYPVLYTPAPGDHFTFNQSSRVYICILPLHGARALTHALNDVWVYALDPFTGIVLFFQDKVTFIKIKPASVDADGTVVFTPQLS